MDIAMDETRKRSRGRPRKEQLDKDTDHRRKRARLAQRSFQQRRQNQLASARQQVSILHEVVEQMSGEFASLSDTLLQSEVAMKDSQLTGRFDESMRRMLMLAEKAANLDLREPPEDSMAKNSALFESDVFELPPPPSSRAFERPEEIGLRRRISQSSVKRPNVLESPALTSADPAVSLSGSFSPRLNYGIWTSSDNPSAESASELVHLVKAGRDSLGTRLFWDSMVLGYRSLRGDEGFSMDVARQIFRFKTHLSTRTETLCSIGYYINRMLHGATDVAYEHLEDVLHSKLRVSEASKTKIITEISMEGGQESDYLNPLEVEVYMRNKWNLYLEAGVIRVRSYRSSTSMQSKRFDAPSCNSWLGKSTASIDPKKTQFPSPLAQPSALSELERSLSGRLHSKPLYQEESGLSFTADGAATINDVNSLVNKLSASAVALIDGPRFAMADVDTIVEAFLIQNGWASFDRK